MNIPLSALVCLSILLAGCATTNEREQSFKAPKDNDDSAKALLAATLIASSMQDVANAPVFEATVTAQDSEVIEDLKKHYKEKKTWDLDFSDHHNFTTIKSVELEEESSSLYGSILRTNGTRLIFRIRPDLSVTYSTLPNEFYKAIIERTKEWNQEEPEYTGWDAFFDALPQALSHL